MRINSRSLVRCVGVLCLLSFLALAPAHADQIGVSWNGGTGNWSASSNWTPATVPNNAGATTYTVAISAPSSVVTMDVLNDTEDSVSVGNAAAVSISAGKSLSVVSGLSVGSTLSNSGTLNVNGTSSVGGDGEIINGSGGYFNNYGTLTSAVGGRITDASGGYLTNYGTVNLGDGSGAFNNESGAYLTNLGTIGIGDSYFANSGTISNSGSITIVTPYASLYNFGTINNSGTISNYNQFQSAGVINNSGTINLQSSGLSNLQSQFVNSGTINNSGTIQNFSSFVNSGAINNSGTFTNSGAVIISSGGNFTTTSNYTQLGGNTTVDGVLTATGGAIVDIQGGSLSGSGTISGNVVVAGILQPGDAPGTLTIDGNYEQTDTGIFDELLSPQSQSLLDVTGDIELDPGTSLEISLLDGFDPLGQTFDIMDFASLTGEFSNGSSFWDDSYLWSIAYEQNQIDITATQAPEPSSVLLLLMGIGMMALLSLRKLRKQRRIA